MKSTMITHLRTLLADPDRPDRDALFKVFADEQASTVLTCLAPPGSLVQIAAALRSGWAWDCDGWERHIDELMGIITDPRCPSQNRMIETWSCIPSAVGVLRDRTDTLIAWVEQRLTPWIYADLAILLGPSDASLRLLVQSPSLETIGTTLRCWSMSTDSVDPTVWQAMIDADLRAALHQRAAPSRAFPAWGRDTSVAPETVLSIIVTDLLNGWSPDHPSLRERIGWLENHVTPDLHVRHLALVASIGRSDTLAEAVCMRIVHNHLHIPSIASDVPWTRLHPRIRSTVDTTMQQSSNDQWKRTWACAIGRFPIMPDNEIDVFLLLWRIDREQWESLDSALRADLVSRSVFSSHCYGWGVHPDLVAGMFRPNSQDVRFWNPDVPPDDLHAWAYADLFWAQKGFQKARGLIALLDSLPPDRRVRFDAIIDGRLGGRPEATARPPWDWAVWVALSAADRQRRLRDRLSVLWGDRDTLPAVRCWRARNDGLATLALMVGDVLGLDDPSPILAALLAQIPALRGDMPNPTPPIPFPNDLNAALRTRITRLPIAPNDQAYAAWSLWVLARGARVGTDLIALHPDVAIALAPLLNADQQKEIAASPAAQGWESMTHLRWVAACAPTQELPPPPIPRRIR